jgi:hypothetical protein
MQSTLALLAIATSSLLIGWIGLRDAKRLRVQDGGSASRQAFTTARRRVLVLAALAPGVLLIACGWSSSAIMWLGGTVTLTWLWVLWLARPRGALARRAR